MLQIFTRWFNDIPMIISPYHIYSTKKRKTSLNRTSPIYVLTLQVMYIFFYIQNWCFAMKIVQIIMLGILAIATNLYADTLSVQLSVEKKEVFVGEPFTMQIDVLGSEKPEQPDVSSISGFTVENIGSYRNSQDSIFVFNGRVTRQVRLGYIFKYRLTAQKAGVFTIPPITVKAEGREVQTMPVQITVRKPTQTLNFKLKQELSKTQCYVGEPVILTIILYIAQEVRMIDIRVPNHAEKKEEFFVADAKVPNGGNAVRIMVNGQAVTAEQRQTFMEGRNWTMVSIRKVLIPKKAGDFELEASNAVLEALAGYQRRRSIFDSMFDSMLDDDFPFGRQKIYTRVVVGSDPIKLHVDSIPEVGRPPNFAGHVGRYRIETRATPTEVAVGDPITLRIEISGPEYLEYVDLPSLENQEALARDFKIPREIGTGSIEGNKKVFTQTVRALREDVKVIPPIELPYFDTDEGKFAVARSKSIPLKVKSTRVITAADAEALSVVTVGNEPEVWTKGICHNYEDMSVLSNQNYDFWHLLGSTPGITLVIVPPIWYFTLLVVVVIMQRRRADPWTLQSRRAYRQLIRKLRSIHKTEADMADVCESLYEAIREYLGAKLKITASALTFADVENKLRELGVSSDTVDSIADIFRWCETGRYAGLTTERNEAYQKIDQTFKIAYEIEKTIK